MSDRHTGNIVPAIEQEEHRTVGSVAAKATAPYQFDGANLVPGTSPAQAVKTQVVGSITYMAQAPAGTDQASAAWRACKIDNTTGTIITWANGNNNYANVATDLTVLTYS